MNSYFGTAVFVSSNIYMLVIGIIAAYAFLQYYVSSGVTRKDYLKVLPSLLSVFRSAFRSSQA